MTRTVSCVVLKAQSEGLDEPPHPGELGQRIYDSVSKKAGVSGSNACRRLSMKTV